MATPLHIVCPNCSGVNRVPDDRLGAEPRCGKCHSELFQAHPVELTDANFRTHVERSDIPLVVDFWAAWCGPCKMMAPAFEQAAAQLEPGVRLGKLDTERHQMTAAQFGIRSIPTLIIFRNGSEHARISGALDLGSLVGWVRQNAY